MRFKNVAVALAVIGVCGAGLGISKPASAATNIVTNGSFESPAVGGSYTQVSGTAVTGWNIDSGNMDLVNTLWTASNGSNSLDMDGNQPGSIVQTLSTTTGQKYNLTFDLAGNPTSGNAIKTVKVMWGASVLAPLLSTPPVIPMVVWAGRPLR